MKRRQALAALLPLAAPGFAAPASQGMRVLSRLQLSRLMGTGWNLGNSLEAIGGETTWGKSTSSPVGWIAMTGARFSSNSTGSAAALIGTATLAGISAG